MTTNTTTHAQDVASALELLIVAVKYLQAMQVAVNKIRRELDCGTSLRIAAEANLKSAERLLECAVTHAEGVLAR